MQKSGNAGIGPLLELVDQQEKLLAELTQRAEVLAAQARHFESVFAEMTKQNQQRDHAIAALQKELARHEQVFDAMTRQNEQRDEAIASLARTR